MLNDLEFGSWCQRLCLSKAACQVIAQIRSSDPSRRVNSGRGNVSGNYPSLKMGVTIQFESHRNELARIYELEHDPNVLEYYDQPPPIELDYLARVDGTIDTSTLPTSLCCVLTKQVGKSARLNKTC